MKTGSHSSRGEVAAAFCLSSAFAGFPKTRPAFFEVPVPIPRSRSAFES